MLDPIDIFLAEIGKRLLEIVDLMLCDGEILNEVPDSLKASKDDILPTEGILPEENLEGCLILVLVVLEVGVRAGELVEVVEEKVNLVLVAAHLVSQKNLIRRFIYFLFNLGEEVLELWRNVERLQNTEIE